MESISSALLIHGGALGDFVLSLSIVQASKLSGVRRIAVLARGAHQPLAIRGGADEFWNLDASPWHQLFSTAPITDDSMAELGRCELAIDLLGGEVLPDQLRAAGVQRVVSVDPRPRPQTTTHITRQWAADFFAAGLELPPLAPPWIEIAADEKEWARSKLRASLRRESDALIMIHPGSGSPAKCWPIDYYMHLAHLMKERGAVVFCLGEAEMECWPQRIIERLAGVGFIQLGLSLEQLAVTIAAADLYIGNDSGVSHLAAAVGTATLAIFGPTSPVVWGPRGDCVEIISDPLTGSWPTPESVHATASAMLTGFDTMNRGAD